MPIFGKKTTFGAGCELPCRKPMSKPNPYVAKLVNSTKRRHNSPTLEPVTSTKSLFLVKPQFVLVWFVPRGLPAKKVCFFYES